MCLYTFLNVWLVTLYTKYVYVAQVSIRWFGQHLSSMLSYHLLPTMWQCQHLLNQPGWELEGRSTHTLLVTWNQPWARLEHSTLTCISLAFDGQFVDTTGLFNIILHVFSTLACTIGYNYHHHTPPMTCGVLFCVLCVWYISSACTWKCDFDDFFYKSALYCLLCCSHLYHIHLIGTEL